MPREQHPKPLGKKVGQSETEAGRVQDDYEVSKFYISSTDKFHNNERLRLNKEQNTIRVPPFVWALANKWVNDDRTPYRAHPDIFRDALVHRIYQLELLAESPPERWKSVEIQIEMMRRGQEAEAWKEAVANAKDLILTAWSDGDLGLFRQQMEQAEQLAATLPEPYNEMLMGFVRDQQSLRLLNREGGA